MSRRVDPNNQKILIFMSHSRPANWNCIPSMQVRAKYRDTFCMEASELEISSDQQV